jgi:hypothetical protein
VLSVSENVCHVVQLGRHTLECLLDLGLEELAGRRIRQALALAAAVASQYFLSRTDVT